MKKTILASALLATALPAAAAMNVVATTSSMGVLANAVGGSAVKVTVLAPPDRDVHVLQARPSMMVALRRADLLVAIGAELEIGWLPAALKGSGNGKILPGAPGYFEAAAQVPLLEAGQAADRSQGDVHPMGNPHLYLDPVRMAKVADALAGRLATLDAPNAARYRAGAAAFRAAVEARVPGWKAKAGGAQGVLLFHKDVNYLAALLGVPILGYVEPLPGIPPTASHLRELTGRFKGQKGVLLFTDFQPGQGPEFLARNLGWPKVRLPLEPAVGASTEEYLAHVDRWVEGVASGK
ncbi:High-affinity zinc uptake system protein ZnuA [Gammaproteobacteria bacterium]|nr:High-affinity zinc uptake system protein ZnuA [Gammaproteobacteria bacterium]